MNALKLKARIMVEGLTIDDVCAKLQISRAAWFRKIAGTTQFTLREVAILREMLKLDEDMLEEIFFEREVS